MSTRMLYVLLAVASGLFWAGIAWVIAGKIPAAITFVVAGFGMWFVLNLAYTSGRGS